MNKYVLQVFVSTPAQEAKRPFYKRDVLNLCCVPDGERLALAFKKKWIADSVLGHLRSGDVSVAGWQAILIFCEDLKLKTGDVYRFHPIRRATISRAIDGGAGVTFEMQLGEFFAIDESSVANVHEMIIKQGNEHPNHRREESGEPSKNAKFVRCSPNNLDLTTSADIWDSLVGRISNLIGLKDSLFFAITDELGTQYPRFPLGTTTSDSHLRPEIKLRRGAEAQLSLYAIAGREAVFAPPAINVSDAVIRASGPFVRQYMNGYSVRYYLQVKSGWDNDSTMLSIALPYQQSDGSISFQSPEIAFHVRVVPRIGLTIVVVLLLALGTALSSLDRDTLSALKLSPDLSLVAKALGPILLGIGAFVGFRTLPGQGG